MIKKFKFLSFIITCIIIILIIILGSCFLPKNDNEDLPDESLVSIDNPDSFNHVTSPLLPSDISDGNIGEDKFSDELRGVWVPTVYNLDFPSKAGLSPDELKKELDFIVSVTKSAGLNAIFFQVRPSADALYNSVVFPTSKYLVVKEGLALADNFDPLQYLIEKAHLKGIKVHAWINPYRISVSNISIEDLSENHPARKNPTWVIKSTTNGRLYFDPAILEVRQLIINGALEIVKNYNIDGIHFDDYFYPDDDGFNDSASFEKYKGEFTDLAAWRRNNVDLLIKDCYSAVKAEKSTVVFGIAPCGVWANKSTSELGTDTSGYFESYSQAFADTRKWVKEGWLDYICPQIYWSDTFQTIANWWNETVKDTKVKLYIGHAIYRLGEEGFEYSNIFTDQINYSRKLENYSGSIFYRYNDILKNKNSIKDALASLYIPSVRKNSEVLTIGFPLNNFSTSYNRIWVTGGSNPNLPLQYNGVDIERTANGLFSFPVDLKVGKNVIKLTNGNSSSSITVTRKKITKTALILQVEKDSLINFLSLGDEKEETNIAVFDKIPTTMLFDTIPIRNYDTALYSPNGISDYIIKEKKTINYVSEEEITVVKLSCGLWVNKNNISVIKGVLENGKIVNDKIDYTDKKTILTIPAGSNLPVTVKESKDNIEVKVYNVSTYEKNNIKLPKNPLFSKVTVKFENNVLIYIFDLKNPNGFFGYKAYAKDGIICVEFRNPVNIINTEKPLTGVIIAIDVGHGPNYRGSSGPDTPNDYKERMLNYYTSVLVKKNLEELGATVFLSRDDKTPETGTIGPIVVREWYNEVNADIAIGIHYNAVDANTNPFKFSGVLGLYSNLHSIKLAENVAYGTSYYALRSLRGVGKDDYIVCNIPTLPSIILECGYLTNIYEYDWFIKPENREYFSKAVSLSILDYFYYQDSFYKK